jgi:hypothetical protein
VAAAPASAQRTVLAFAGMVLSIVAAWTIRAHVLEAASKPPDGPLSSYVVAATAAPDCSGAACTVALVAPEAGVVRRVQEIRYSLPAEELIAAPAGSTIVPVPPALLYTSLSDTRSLPFTIVRQGVSREEGAPTLIPVLRAGWLRGARELRSGQYFDFANARSLPASAPVAFSDLSFQPVPTMLNVVLSKRWRGGPNNGDVLQLHFVSPEVESAATLAPADRPVEVRVSQAEVPSSPLAMVLYIDPGDTYRLLDQRFGSAEPREPLPQRLWIEWIDRGGNAQITGQWRVPASALQRDAEGTRVWVAVDGRAIPVTVDELQCGEESCVVVERAGARGLPVRLADWVALGSAARAAAFRAASADHAHLLRANASVLAAIPPGLQPGAGVGPR